ncbi:MAG: MFS transporter [Dehalococcoidia bacterium]|nr:MFS transporter [Dehalococcoidia bacterium]
MMGGRGGMGGGVGVIERSSGRGSGLRTFESLKNAGYRIFWLSMMAQMAAMNMQMVVQSLLVYEVTGSALWLGGVSLASAMPMLIFSLYGGVIADRVQKKYVLIVGQAALFTTTLVMALLIFLGAINGPFLLAGAAVQGFVWALVMPSRQGLVRELVSREGLMNALSLNIGGMNVNRLFLPAVAGLLVGLTGGIGASAYALPYFVMAGLLLVATLTSLLLPKGGEVALRGSGALKDIAEGVQYVRQNPTILTILLITLVGVVLSMPYISLLPVFTKTVWGVGPGAFGVLLSVSGIGALAGSLFLASIGNKKRGLLYLGSLLLTGVSLSLLAFSPSYQMALVVIVLVGLAQAGRMTLSQTLVQYYTDEQYQGRVMSIYMMEWGLTSFATFGVALLVEPIGVQWAVGGCAIALTVMAAVAFFVVPRLRKLD